MSPWASAHCPHRGWGTLQGLGDRTGAGLAGERELLDLWGGGVAVIVRLMDPPVWSLPKKDPEKKGEWGLWGSWAAERVSTVAVPALAWDLEEAKNPGVVQGDP